jgi:hypothetical protein
MMIDGRLRRRGGADDVVGPIPAKFSENYVF